MSSTQIPEGEVVGDGEQPSVWEQWLGLYTGEVSLTQSPERLFQRCLEMGASGARFPRLLIRLQYLPGSGAAQPRNSSMELRSGSISSLPGGTSQAPASASRPVAPPLTGSNLQAGDATVPRPSESAAKSEDLPSRLLALELENQRLRQEEAQREAAEHEFVDQVSAVLGQFGHQLPVTAGQRQLPLSKVAASLAEALSASQSKAAKLAAADKEAREVALRAALKAFYKPVKSDPVDCLLAASLLRLDSPAIELERVGPGQYRIGQRSGRLRLFTEADKLLVVEDLNGSEAPPVEFAAYLATVSGGLARSGSRIQASPARSPTR